MRVPMAAGLAWLCLLSACDSPTRTLDVAQSPSIRKQFCYFDPCVLSTYEGAAYVASARVTDLGVPPGDIQSFANDVNDAGQIVGSSFDANGNSHALLWFPPNQTTPQELVTLGGPTSEATGINAKGMITGWSTTPSGQQDGFVWNFGLQQHLTYSNPLKTAYALYPQRIDDSGTVVGTIFNSNQDQMAYWPAGFSAATVPTLEPGNFGTEGVDINNSGTIVGTIDPPSNQDSIFTWQNGQQSVMQPCLPQAHCYAGGISDSGQIAGSFSNPDFHAFVQDGFGTHILGSLWPGQPTQPSEATDIDNHDLAVGWSADSTSLGEFDAGFVWGSDFGMSALPSLPGAPPNSVAYGMNPNLLGDSILIVGYGYTAKGNETHALLWSVTLGLKPVFTIWPGVWGRPFTPIIYENPAYLSNPNYDRYIEVKFAGAGNLDPNTIDLSSLQMNGTQPVYTEIKDLNGDGYQDLLMLFSMKQLMQSGGLTARTIQLKVTGNLLKIGAPLLATSGVTICLSQRSCPTDDTVTGPM